MISNLVSKANERVLTSSNLIPNLQTNATHFKGPILESIFMGKFEMTLQTIYKKVSSNRTKRWLTRTDFKAPITKEVVDILVSLN